jgi:hypothetical protein
MPEQTKNKSVIPFYTLRLGDLIRPRARLIATCGFCGRASTLDAVGLAYAEGPRTLLKSVEARLRCRGCAARGWSGSADRRTGNAALRRQSHPFQGCILACVRTRAVAQWARAVAPST